MTDIRRGRGMVCLVYNDRFHTSRVKLLETCGSQKGLVGCNSPSHAIRRIQHSTSADNSQVSLARSFVL